jgi:hypothetical protein
MRKAMRFERVDDHRGCWCFAQEKGHIPRTIGDCEDSLEITSQLDPDYHC